MKFDLNRSIEILERSPQVYNSLLSGLSKEWTHCNEGNGTWSAYDIVGHLIHGEITDWIPRLKIILSEDSDKTFEPFDRFAQEKNSKGKTLGELLNTFEELRTKNVAYLRSLKLSDQDLDSKGMHPDLGEVTCKELLATWTIHDLSHIHQLTRVMVRQYGDEVGPWEKYIGIFQKK